MLAAHLIHHLHEVVQVHALVSRAGQIGLRLGRMFERALVLREGVECGFVRHIGLFNSVEGAEHPVLVVLLTSSYVFFVDSFLPRLDGLVRSRLLTKVRHLGCFARGCGC